MTNLVRIGTLFLLLILAAPSWAKTEVGDVVAVRGACTKTGVLSLLNGQKTDGMAGFMAAVQRAEEAGMCRQFPQIVMAEVQAVEYFGLLSDGQNYIIDIGGGLWVIDVVRDGGVSA